MSLTVSNASTYYLNGGNLTYDTDENIVLNENSLVIALIGSYRSRTSAAKPSAVSLSNGQVLTKRKNAYFFDDGSTIIAADIWWGRARGVAETVSAHIEFDALPFGISCAFLSIDGVKDFDTPFDDGVSNANPLASGRASITAGTLTAINVTHVKKNVMNIGYFMSLTPGLRGPFTFGTSLINENAPGGPFSQAVSYEYVNSAPSVAPNRSMNFAGSMGVGIILGDAINGEDAPDKPQVRPLIFMTG